MPTPEQATREEIDRLLTAAGCSACEPAGANIRVHRGRVASDQIRSILRTFRDKRPEILPVRTWVPKTP